MEKKALENEVAKELDLSVIRYSRVFEDHRVLSRALQIKKDEDVILSITSSGDNVLNLLLEEPKQIGTLYDLLRVAVDMSPAQNAVLELKLAAIANLNYGEYLLLLGEREDDQLQRPKIYQKIKLSLPSYAQDYWDCHQDTLQEGVAQCGRFQKNFLASYFEERLSKVVTIEEIDRFMAAETLDEQRRLFDQLPLDKMKIIQAKHVSRTQQKSGRSAAQLKYVEQSDEEIAEEVWQRFCRVSREVPVADNFYHGWWLRGKRNYDPETTPNLVPPYLTKEGFTKLKSLVDRVVVFTGTIEAYLNQNTSQRITKANLSDIFEYMSEEDSDKTFTYLSDHLESGGRVAYWNALNRRVPPDSCKLTLQQTESKQLHEMDRMFFYCAFYVTQKE